MRRALEALPGVRRVEVDFYKKQAVVTVEETASDERKLIQALAEAGFGASVQEAKRIAASSVAEAEKSTPDIASEQAAAGPTGAAYSPPIFGEHAPISAHLDRSVLRPGDSFRVAIVFDIDEGWHIYGNPLGPGIGLPTVISAKAPKGFRFDPARYAPAHRMEQNFGEAGKTWVGQHTGETIHYLSGRVSQDVEPGTHDLTVEVSAQLCDPTHCIRSKAIIPLRVTVAPKGAPSESINDELFTGFEAASTPARNRASMRRAVLDTGFTHNFLIQPDQLKSWAGLMPEHLKQLGQFRAYGELVPLHAANVWLHPNAPGERDQFSGAPPFRVELDLGIGICPTGMQRAPRLPLLALRRLDRADLELLLRHRRLTLRTPRRFWFF